MVTFCLRIQKNWFISGGVSIRKPHDENKKSLHVILSLVENENNVYFLNEIRKSGSAAQSPSIWLLRFFYCLVVIPKFRKLHSTVPCGLNNALSIYTLLSINIINVDYRCCNAARESSFGCSYRLACKINRHFFSIWLIFFGL